MQRYAIIAQRHTWSGDAECISPDQMVGVFSSYEYASSALYRIRERVFKNPERYGYTEYRIEKVR